MTISLIISTYNWPDALKRVLEGVRNQKILPDEVIIADDGSTEDTREVIELEACDFPVPLHHVWHEDHGFRRAEIMNKAIASAHGDYIVQLDGDCIPDKRFIKDHREMREKGYFVCGSRVMLKENGNIKASHFLNMLRSRLLRYWYAHRRTTFSRRHVRGCNLAFWRMDFIDVNGYNEDITGWGCEDHDLVYRMIFNGMKEHRLKFGGNYISYMASISVKSKYKQQQCCYERYCS